MQVNTEINHWDIREGVNSLRPGASIGPSNLGVAHTQEAMRRADEAAASAGAGIPTSTGQSLTEAESSKEPSDNDPTKTQEAGETGNDPPFQG